MTDLRGDKKAWRDLADKLFSLASPVSRRGLDALLAERVEGYVGSRDVIRLMGFAPLPDEPGLEPFFRAWLAGGGYLVMPLWPGGPKMNLRRIKDWDRDLRPGRSDILEPVDGTEDVNANALDMVIAPGRLFSESGTRLGRGAGCYDALFARSRALRIGVAYDFQVMPELPADSGDVPVDVLITPSRIVSFDA